MQGGNRFLDFANEIMARHQGLGFGFEPAAMLYLEDQEKTPEEQTAAHQNITTNLYHIQNIKEENYLFKQNLSFLTQVLENKIYNKLYPSVEKQIEQTIREELPEAEQKIVHSVSQQLVRLVEQGGIREFEQLREKVLSEYHEKEIIHLKEQERLFRKIENIWNSSIYQQTVWNKPVIAENNPAFIQSNDVVIREENQVLEEIEHTNVQNFYKNVSQQSQNIQNIHEHRQHLSNILKNTDENHLLVQKNQEFVQNISHKGVQQDYYITQPEIVHPEQTEEQMQIFSDERSVEKSRSSESPVIEVRTAEYNNTERNNVEHNSTEYHNLVHNNTQSLEIVHNQSVLEKTLKFLENRNQILFNIQEHGIGNLGEIYQLKTENSFAEKIIEFYTKEKATEHSLEHAAKETALEYIQEETLPLQEVILQVLQQTEGKEQKKLLQSQTEIQKQLEKQIETEEKLKTEKIYEPKVLGENQFTENILQKNLAHISLTNQLEDYKTFVSSRTDNLHLEYPSEETMQLNQEMLQMLHSEIQRIPEIPKIVKESLSEKATEEQLRTQMVEKTKTISEQILSRMEITGIVPVSRKNAVAKTVTLNKLSHVILEYADSKTTSEQLHTNMLQILENYRTDTVHILGDERVHVLKNLGTEIGSNESAGQRFNKNLIRSMGKKGHVPELIQAMEPAAIVYHSEESDLPQQQEKTKRLEQKVQEVVKTLKNVEEKTIVHKEQIIEQQKMVVHEVLKSHPAIWSEGEGAGYIRSEVQQSLEEQLNQNVNHIANKVYRQLENKLKSERGRRGLI